MIRITGLTSFIVALVAIGLSSSTVLESNAQSSWWKGNLHTHSLWSDGDDYPEPIMAWYRENGYHFNVLSDHNTLAEGSRWIDPSRQGWPGSFEAYRARFGDNWVETRGDDTLEVRLKTLEEYRTLFEEPGEFLIIQSEEISDHFERRPIHLNATNIQEFIPPQGGESAAEVIQNNVDAVLEQRERTGQPMFPHTNHPNFGWALTAEDFFELEGHKFFEVYNGHFLVNILGDSLRPGTERMWDIILTARLVRGAELMYGLATDDAHHYSAYDTDHANPGRGWVVVQAPELTTAALIEAMEAGEFYASNGVELEDVEIRDDGINIRIRPEAGVTYRTEFIGTRKGFDASSEAVFDDEGNAVTRRYSDDVGEVLAEVDGEEPSYTFEGDEMYVRAKVTSSTQKENPYTPGEFEMAWIQPVVVAR